jgi:hypothetical protein
MKRVRTDFRFLFFSLIAMSLLGPILGTSFYRYGIMELTFTAVLISVVARSDRGPAQMTISLVLGIPALLSMVSGRFTHEGLLPMARSVLVAAFLGYTAYVVLSSILRTRGITSQEVFGALSVYLLLGMTWQFFFALCLQADPGAISFPEGPSSLTSSPAESELTMQNLTYFSFVTLSTLGYGDIVPVSRMARTLAWMEAVFGQLFLAVLVARLVGLMKSDRSNNEEA